MPLNKSLKKVMVIGSGPIVIGQAAEFDYAGTQACRALKEEGLEVVLVNSNPATIMTDSAIADHVYIEPLTLEFVKRIIEKEKPDSILSTLGGQTGLTLSMELAKEGFLKSHNVTLLGASPETIDKAEDRQCFKDTMEAIGEPVIPSKVVTTIEDALDFAEVISYPVIVRPAFTLGGTGGGIAANKEELYNIAEAGIRLSPINQILVEKCISGWKEIEFEVMRDAIGNEITVCSMENFDPVGVHTGDSIVIAPAVTLADKEYQMLRSAALNIIQAMGIEGGCNCQFALNPESFEYAVIEVNPRVSRSSALASKATGYPIARVATKIAIGYHLDEIPNEVTGVPMVDLATRIMMGEKLADMGYETGLYPCSPYYAVKVPVFSFEKLSNVDTQLGPEMKSTGEVLGIARTMEEALFKGLVAAGYTMKREGGVLISVRDTDKSDLRELVKEYVAMGFHIYATSGTASRLNSVGISSTLVKKPKEAKEGEETTISLLEEGKISYVISTSKTGRQPGRDSVRLRRKAVELGIPCLTSLDTAAVLALTLESQYNEDNVELVDIAHIAHGAAARKELSQMEKPEEIQIPGYVLQEHDND